MLSGNNTIRNIEEITAKKTIIKLFNEDSAIMFVKILKSTYLVTEGVSKIGQDRIFGQFY